MRTPFHIHWKVSKAENYTRLKTAIKVTVVLNNSRMKMKVCFVDKSSPLRVISARSNQECKVLFRNEETQNKNIQHDAKRQFSDFV